MSQWEGGSSSSGYGYGYGPSSPGQYGEREPGARRRRLAAMAKSVYQATAATASEIRNQYDNTRIRGVVDVNDSSYKVSIPGAFPDVAIVTKGEEQMVLFPSYAKRHVRQFKDDDRRPSAHVEAERRETGMSEEDYWHNEWARMEDKKAVVDVDVRGWVYAPHKGPMTRKNRVLIGLARRLSGIPAATHQVAGELQDLKSGHEEREDTREQQKIDKEAEAIERQYRNENEAAVRGGYSETPKEDDSGGEGRISPTRTRSGSNPSMSIPPSPRLSERPTTNGPSTELTGAELAVANANLMARLGPFLTTPLVQLPVTLFFYDDQNSVSKTVMTNDAGHFSIRAALDFVPTHVRVLANEDLSAVHEVEIIDDEGVSLISDIDDTVKKSSISLGAREIFRNTFIRDLKELAVDGVREWYGELYKMGVSFHYCSNSPWQLFPVIATFFRHADLPPGSLHLKQYSGMLQGIFEPVAERKKGTLERILRDFPNRKFILVGDSGEADLEVYTDLALANPKRILAIFIRDVTTPEQAGYFDAAFGSPSFPRSPTRQPATNVPSRQHSRDDDSTTKPTLPPRTLSEPSGQAVPVEEDLIDFSDEPREISPMEHENLEKFAGGSSAAADLKDLATRKKPPPPRPNKPAALKSESSTTPSDGQSPANGSNPPVPPRKPVATQIKNAIPHPLTQMQNSSGQKLASSPNLSSGTGNINFNPGSTTPSNPSSSSNSVSATNSNKQAPPPPPPRRRATPSSLNVSPNTRDLRHSVSNSNIEGLNLNSSASTPPPRPPNRTNTAATFDTILGATTGHSMQQGGQYVPINKKLELWRRRLQRAHETLDSQGVRLYTWRKGEDVVLEAVGIVREEKERSLKTARK
ncbi:hypothetical protein VMCG_10037 [Cytospora schulzeri]|uniref:Phosphatidate phosphatase APP1 catalytic domain-containing protein n=1 Tax=Cytospora schulzeri TaxID=448051 RepID=A0A423VIA2_9PEZI|nr:hypothetical protein VMCG_10037 [Valsa malicola]